MTYAYQMLGDKIMLTGHVRKEFKNETINLNGNYFIECTFIDCILNCMDTGSDPDGFIRFINCHYVNIVYKGRGWPDELLELLKKGEPFSWAGKIGQATRH